MPSIVAYTHKFFLFLLILLTVSVYGHAFIYADVNYDAGYYLSLAQQVVDGNRLYQDILNNYSPLAMYYFAGIMVLFGDQYAINLAFMFLVIFLSALALYGCLKELSPNKVLNLSFTFLYLVANYLYEANYIYLEPFVNLFGVLSIYFLLQWRKQEQVLYILLAGSCGCLAFLSKQYGIIYLFFAGLFLLSELFAQPVFPVKKTLRVLVQFGFGALIPMLLLGLVYTVQGISLDIFFRSLYMRAYADESGTKYFAASWRFLYENCLPFLMLPLVFVFSRSKYHVHMRRVLVFLLLLILLTTVYYVKAFAHYAILLLPAVYLVFASLYSFFAEIGSRKYKVGFLILFWISVSITAYLAVLKFQKNRLTWDRAGQLASALEIRKILPPKSTVLVLHNAQFYYLCDLKPFLPKKYGYAFVNGLTAPQFDELLKASDTFLLNPVQKEAYIKDKEGKTIQVKNCNCLVVKP